MLSCRFLNAVMAALILTLTGCATSGPGELECETDEQCPAGQACDTEEGICVRASISTNNDNNISPNGNPNGNPNNIPRPNNDTDMGGGGEEDMGDPCNGTCSGNEVCSAGECVPECMPACEDYEQCTANGCEIPDCTAAGDACDLTNPDQGSFACVDIEEPFGLCLEKCDDPYTVDTCETGEYCWNFDGANVCLPDLCDTNSDCTSGGTCVDWDNDFSTCFRAGSLPAGSACDPTDSQCEQGTFCRETTSDTTGVCSEICNPWAADPGCGGGQYCGEPLTTRYWLCSDDTDTTAPNDPWFQCFDPGTVCDDGIRCFDFGTQSGCMQYCRPGENDCANVTAANSAPTTCHPFIFPGQRAVGLCDTTCDPNVANDCGTGAVCVDNICRISCTVGNEVQDCCGGNTPCNWSCNPQSRLCE